MAKDPVDHKTRELPTGLRIGYARVSTAEQDVQMQIDALETAGVSKLYKETGSGMKADRPELAHCLAALRPGDTLVVWRLDRLGRSLRDLVDTVEKLAADGIGLVSLTESIDTTTAAGKLIVHVFAALAEFERNLIVERTKAGLAASRKQGRRGGRPPAMTDKDIEVAIALSKSPDLTATEIAARLGVSKTTLYKYLPKT